MAQKKATGRPTKYSPEIAESICIEIATTEHGIHKVAESHGVAASTILLWLINNKEFSDNYARAKDLQAELMAQRIIEIADDTSRDTITNDETGAEYANHEWINRSRLRVDSRKWLMSKLAPKKYGDKLDITTAGESITTKAITIEPVSKNKG